MEKRNEMSIPSLPDQTLVKIFARLPAKSVGKCKCLAKIWPSELSTPDFIKSHLNHSSKREHLILIDTNGSTNLVEDGGDSRVFLPEAFTGVLGSCDGLVMLVRTEDNVKCVVNPYTLQLIEVPPLDLEGEDWHSNYGLGYDSENKEYKIVVLSTSTLEATPVLVHVYSLKSGVWKRAIDLPFVYVETRCGVFVNGAIHWLGRSRENEEETVVIAFDLKDEKFGKMSGPSGVDVGEFMLSEIAVLEGCLCLVYQNDDEMEVWTMKEYNAAESWTRISVDMDNEEQKFDNIMKPVCLFGDDEVILLTEGELVVYNVNSHAFRHLSIEGGPDGSVDGYAFVDILVSPLPA